MRNVIVITACFFLIMDAIRAQDIPGLKSDLASGIQVTYERIYDGSSLYGYIDGGAELYLAYDFERLRMQEVSLGKHTYTVQVYAMKDPVNAYGIYSLYRFRCMAGNMLTTQDCLTAYQYLACKQNYYISIINGTGDSLARVESLILASALLEKIPDAQVEWPAVFTIQPFSAYTSSSKFIRGMTGLQQGMIDWNEWFDGLGNFTCWLLPMENIDGGTVIIAAIDFTNEVDRSEFIKRSAATLVNESAPLPGQNILAWKKGNTQVVFLDATGTTSDISRLVSAITQEIAPPVRL